jgi:hypothetical protein
MLQTAATPPLWPNTRQTVSLVQQQLPAASSPRPCYPRAQALVAAPLLLARPQEADGADQRLLQVRGREHPGSPRVAALRRAGEGGAERARDLPPPPAQRQYPRGARRSAPAAAARPAAFCRGARPPAVSGAHALGAGRVPDTRRELLRESVRAQLRELRAQSSAARARTLP